MNSVVLGGAFHYIHRQETTRLYQNAYDFFKAKDGYYVLISISAIRIIYSAQISRKWWKNSTFARSFKKLFILSLGRLHFIQLSCSHNNCSFAFCVLLALPLLCVYICVSFPTYKGIVGSFTTYLIISLRLRIFQNYTFGWQQAVHYILCYNALVLDCTQLYLCTVGGESTSPSSLLNIP